MIEHHNPWDILWKLMEEDIASYQALLEDMRQEWECLKKDDVSSLLPLLRTKEAHISMIKANRESMVQILNERLGEAIGKSGPWVLSDFLPHVLPSQAQKIMNYKKVIERLRQQIMSLNERNKQFVQETLSYLKGIFSLFTSSNQEESAYAQMRKLMFTSIPPCRMSREV